MVTGYPRTRPAHFLIEKTGGSTPQIGSTVPAGYPGLAGFALIVPSGFICHPAPMGLGPKPDSDLAGTSQYSLTRANGAPAVPGRATSAGTPVSPFDRPGAR
jgi:hypothetical protein